MKKEVQRLLEKADHALKVAESLLKQGFPKDASSKIYYAMFYAAQALLRSDRAVILLVPFESEGYYNYRLLSVPKIRPLNRMVMFRLFCYLRL